MQESSYDAYTHFSAMLDRTGVDWLLCMFEFETYWDNSEPEPATETHPAFPMAIGACYLSTKEQWDEFRRNWDEARVQEGFDVFHMTDFMSSPENGIKPYCEWDQAKRDRVYYRLANIINTRIRCGFTAAMPVESYDKHIPQHVKDAVGKRYFTFVVRSLLAWIQEWYAAYGKGRAVQYVFDRMGKGKGEIMSIFSDMTEFPDLAALLGAKINDPDGLAFQNKEFFKPLQAADILAWNMRTFMYDEIAAGLPEVTPSRIRPYFQFLRKAPLRIAMFRDRQLEKAGADILEYEEREGKPSFKATRRQLKQWKAATEKGTHAGK